MYKEEILGGTLNRVVKAGNTVHRNMEGSPILHLYLRYLEKAGMDGVPRFLGIDEQGREILSYVPGKTQGKEIPLSHPCLRSDETIIGVASFMRKLHDISEGFLPEALENTWLNPEYPFEPCETICHNDAAVWNFVFTDERVTGLIDFDKACAGTRIWDLTQSVYGTVHLQPWVSGEKYEASKHASERKRQVKLFFGAYGIGCPNNFMDMICQRIKIDCCDWLSKGVAVGDERRIKMVKEGTLVFYRKVAAFIKECGQDWL